MTKRLTFLSLLFLGGCATTPVEWVGCPMVSNDDPYFPSQAWLPDYEYGFCDDGVVVWRKRQRVVRQ